MEFLLLIKKEDSSQNLIMLFMEEIKNAFSEIVQHKSI